MHAPPHADPALQRLIDQVRAAAAGRQALEIRGGGTKAFYGQAPRGERLDTRPLAGISSHQPTELVVTARAGTPLVELESALAEHGQCLPFEPPRFARGLSGDERAEPTVGGMIAAGLAGPARARCGSVRDHLLGATILNGRGELLSFGGQVIKNVAGYDVSRLMAGSMGVLGVICEVSLKVLPIAAATSTLTFDLDEAGALKQLNGWTRRPLPLNASAWHDGRLRVRLSGARAAVSAATERLGGTVLSPDAAALWWGDVRDHHHPFFSTPDVGGTALWRLSVPATAAPIALPGASFIEWGGAQRWLRTSASAQEVRAAAAQASGHATLFRGADKTVGVFAPLSAPLMRIHRGLKQAMDPAGIFNPGRLYSDL